MLFPSTQRYRKVNNYTRVIINTPPYSTLLEELGMALAMSEGVLKITGQPGCGKTAVCQQLREQLLSQHTPVVFFADAPEHPGLWTQSDPGPERDYRVLDAALRGLPASQRVPIVLFHFDELSYQQIAERLKVSISKVKTDIHRGREALRAVLTKGGGR